MLFCYYTILLFFDFDEGRKKDRAKVGLARAKDRAGLDMTYIAK